MLSYISSKFSEAPTSAAHEPRAALILNRFTRTSTIMYATSSVSSILGVQADQLVNKSFYFCIAEDCLQQAVRCLESAKSNDSIAYLRFRFRNPLEAETRGDISREESQSEDEDEGGVRLQRTVQPPTFRHQTMDHACSRVQTDETECDTPLADDEGNKSRSTSGVSTDLSGSSADAIFDQARRKQSSSSSLTSPGASPSDINHIEVEAVVSCTSDGMVVVLRRARPSVTHFPDLVDAAELGNTFFVSPWAIPSADLDLAQRDRPRATSAPAGPEASTVMKAIREVAVFAWSLTGINGSLIRHGRGKAEGEALPPEGLPIWDPTSDYPENDRYNGFADNSHRRTSAECNEASSSEDEIVFKRAKVMPEWRRPSRRPHWEAFSHEIEPRDIENGRAPAQKRKIER
jgi:hypothetical protein